MALPAAAAVACATTAVATTERCRQELRGLGGRRAGSKATCSDHRAKLANGRGRQGTATHFFSESSACAKREERDARRKSPGAVAELWGRPWVRTTAWSADTQSAMAAGRGTRAWKARECADVDSDAVFRQPVRRPWTRVRRAHSLVRAAAMPCAGLLVCQLQTCRGVRSPTRTVSSAAGRRRAPTEAHSRSRAVACVRASTGSVSEPARARVEALLEQVGAHCAPVLLARTACNASSCAPVTRRRCGCFGR